MTQRISPALTQDNPAIEGLLARVQARMGFVPNSMRVMAHWPDLLNAFSSLATTVLGPGLLDPAFKQLVAFVTSNAAGCRYCQAHTAHGAHGRGVDEQTSGSSSLTRARIFHLRAGGAAAPSWRRSPSAVDDADFDELPTLFRA
jgi:AhpD family alkylhydroperoxidase